MVCNLKGFVCPDLCQLGNASPSQRVMFQKILQGPALPTLLPWRREGGGEMLLKPEMRLGLYGHVPGAAVGRVGGTYTTLPFCFSSDVTTTTRSVTAQITPRLLRSCPTAAVRAEGEGSHLEGSK